MRYSISRVVQSYWAICAGHCWEVFFYLNKGVYLLCGWLGKGYYREHRLWP